ncbi:hypothetical protein [Cellulosimicrobium sp. CUA-896]|uniref:hypothetical protein n=1 Tax=Cellulosimicrobium sp. CUA-896 TaxID=1517881 RepID=UPI0021010670|nr:hypothetical protein [Cellulosimicrobium sp. CUA-896]
MSAAQGDAMADRQERDATASTSVEGTDEQAREILAFWEPRGRARASGGSGS